MSAQEGQLPPCGVYRTREPVGDVPAGRFVLFHNHGDPGPGIYLPAEWKGNRARFAEQGTPLPDPQDASALEPLSPEGFYRVVAPFHCCEKRCKHFEPDMLVQLGYNGRATPILFVPEIVGGGLALPEQGTPVDGERLRKLHRLRIPVSQTTPQQELH